MTLVRFVVSILYTIAGVSGFVSFIALKNYPGAVFAAATGLISIISNHLHFLNYKNKLGDWYSSQHLFQIACFSFYAFAISTSLMVYFTVAQIMKKTPMLPIEQSLVIPIVWTFMSLKCSLMLLFFARAYATQEHSLLAEESSEEIDTDSGLIEP